MSDELDDLIQGFVEESHEAFEAIENDLLTIEENPEDLSIVNGIFRVLHTIKGTAGFMGLDEINHLAHKLETIFDMIRKEELSINPELMDTLLPAIDLLKLMVFELVEEQKSDYELAGTMEVLETIAAAHSGHDISAPKPAAPKPAAEPQSAPSAGSPPTPPPAAAPVEDGPMVMELVGEFVQEAEEHLQAIEENLLKLENEPGDNEAINEVFRAIHSIKGTAAYVNVGRINRLAHKMETVFDRIRKGSATYSPELADLTLKSLDLLRTLIFMLKMGEDISVIQVDETIALLDKYLTSSETAAPQAPAPEQPATPSVPAGAMGEAVSPLDAFKNICSQHIIALQVAGSELVQGTIGHENLMVLQRSMRTIGGAAEKIGATQLVELIHQYEEIVLAVLSEESNAADVKDQATLLKSGLEAEMNRYLSLSEEGLKEQQAQNGGAPAPASVPAVKKTAPAKKAGAPAAEKKEESSELKTMRVDSYRLDTFMNLIGELIIARNSFNHTLGELSSSNLPGTVIATLRGVESAFNRISEDLQTTLMEMRLIPVKTVFQKIPRIVRDIARKTGKNIQLQMVGENTQIDKSIIEMIGDPLVHIIRNSCDHGVETPEKRRAAGKPEQGNIILKASHLGSSIAIDIIDDGAGVNLPRVLEKAIERGLVRPEQADTLDNKTIANFIFHPGFSTAEEVTDISGRGVGMDVVMTNIQKVHGSVDVDSEPGQGTQVRLLLPLTLAVIDALLVVEQGQMFAIPLEAVKESIEIRESELHQLKQKEAINLRGEIIGVSRLSKLLELPEKEFEEDRVVSVVFVQVGTKLMGVIVDDLYNQQEIVVKPLQQYLTRIPGISGSTILGSGDIILILEPTELVDLASV
ncbi:MAG: chemotaxis protein CheA [bacterium]|nr:chemotaxis protein CheA [bacterium]